MKLIIKTRTIELEYQDDYSNFDENAKERLKEMIRTLYSFEPIQQVPISTVEEFLEATRSKNK
jgi:hypothetical protein